MRRIIAQARKELIQIFRDRLALTLALVLPVFLLLLMGNAISLTVSHLPVVVQDLDASQTSQQYVDAFRASVTFYVNSWPPDRKPVAPYEVDVASHQPVVPDADGEVRRHVGLAAVVLDLAGHDLHRPRAVVPLRVQAPAVGPVGRRDLPTH